MKLILFFTLPLFFFSCNSSEKKGEDSNPFEKLIMVDEAIDLNAVNGSMILFCKSNDFDKIGYMPVYAVVKSYLNDPRFNQQEYKSFVSNIINFNSVFICDDIIDCFHINDTIKSFYNKITFSEFLLKYSSDTINNNEYIISNDISPNSQMSIIYYFYLNNYYTIFDDLSGFYCSRKIDDFSFKLENLDLDRWQ